MLLVILTICWLWFGILILKNKGVKRLCYFYIGILLVPTTMEIIPMSMLMGHLFYASMFIVSLIIHTEFKLNNFKSCPLYKSLAVVFISYILIGLFDERVGPLLGLYRGLAAFMGSYFLFFIGWLSIKKKEVYDCDSECVEGYNIIFKILLPFTLIVTIYGAWTAITHENPVLDAVGLEGRFLNQNLDNYRSFRVTASCVSSSVYGLACSTLFLCSFSTIKYKTRLQVLAIVLLLLNLFLTATRAAIIPFLIGFSVFLIINRGMNTMFKYGLISALLLIIIFPLMPNSYSEFVSQLMDSIVDVISPSGSGGEKYGGSNVDARGMQIAAAMQFLQAKPLLGHGYAYFAEILSIGQKHASLLGMESYLCFLGVEYGILNMLAVSLFYINVIVYFLRNRIYNRLYADLGLSMISMFILYLIFAWVGGCWYFFMPILGYVMKVIYISKFEEETSC